MRLFDSVVNPFLLNNISDFIVAVKYFGLFIFGLNKPNIVQSYYKIIDFHISVQ